MYFTFSEELSYGIDATTQDYVVDLVSEEIITNINYQKIHQFNYPTSESRVPGIKTGKGRIALGLTYGNSGWNVLFKSLIGQSVVLLDFAFAKSSESWNVVTGMLSANLDSSATSFTITEYKAGEFDNIIGVIVGSEYIAVGSISNGVVSVSTRASEATTPTSHDQHTLCYGVVSDAGKNIDIISRYRSGFCYSLPTSLTTMILREGDYFEFTGCLFSDFVFNARKNTLTSSLELRSKNTRVIEIANPSTAVDDNDLVSPLDINCYSMGQYFILQKLYFQISNTLIQGPAKFFDTTYLDMPLSSHSVYGQFTVADESIASYNSYIGDDLRNLSVTMCGSKQFDNAYIFAFNNIRYGTLLRILYSNIDMKGDSVPFYCYDPDGFVIMIQTDSYPESSSSCSSNSRSSSSLSSKSSSSSLSSRSSSSSSSSRSSSFSSSSRSSSSSSSSRSSSSSSSSRSSSSSSSSRSSSSSSSSRSSSSSSSSSRSSSSSSSSRSSSGIDDRAYGVTWDEDNSSPTLTRTGTTSGEGAAAALDNADAPVQALMRRCILNDAGEVQYYLCATDSTKKEDCSTPSNLDGTDGQVMVEIPLFWYLYGYDGGTHVHSWSISLTDQGSDWERHPAFYKDGGWVTHRYIGAYEGIGWDNGTAAYVDCQTGAGNNWAGGAIDLVNDKLGSVSGKAPMMDETRAEFRAIALNRGLGWRQQDFYLISAIQLLYLVEYASFHSQNVIGMGRTQIPGGTWVKDSKIGVTGKSNGDGNATGNTGGNTNDAYMSYRGIENFYGNLWNSVDGFNINDGIPYVSNTETDFADDTTTNYFRLEDTGDSGITLTAESVDYQKTLVQTKYGFLPSALGGSSTTYITDYYFRDAGWRVALLGADAANGVSAGFFYWYLGVDSVTDFTNVGSRLAY